LDERELLIGAMRSANLPKFIREDKELFERIITDLYPDFELGDDKFGWLMDIAKQIATTDKKILTSLFIEKFIQFFDTSNLRFGSMLVGPPNGGKTYIYNLLAKTINSVMHLLGKGTGGEQI
jgi:dynein heavy chain